MPRVLLVTCAAWPDGEPGAATVTAGLAGRGVDSAWAVWDDATVDWTAADLLAVRSTWDYTRRVPEFLAWAREAGAATRLLNGAEAFAWNLDKAYLVPLADDVPTVPTLLCDRDSRGPVLIDALERWGTVVVKPRVGASGIGVVAVTAPDDPRWGRTGPGPWLVQPLVESVRSVGETSVYVFGGRAASAVLKRAGGPEPMEFRVHEEYGGSSRAVRLGDAEGSLAEDAVRAASRRLGVPLDLARVDLLHREGRWVVSELELIEPGLYLDVDPANADRFAELVASLL